MPHWLGKILLVTAGLVVALVLCEAGLRLAGIEYPHFYKFEPHVGTGLRPGIEGYWLPEGGGYVSINSAGQRDREHAVAKPPHTLRIAVLGDSFTEAMQVNREEAFWAILEKKLQGCRNLQGRNIEVINFGVAGYGTTQELLTLKHRVWKYSPDIVLLAFMSGNDVADNSPALNPHEEAPFYVFRDGKLILDDSRTRRAEETWLFYEQHRNWLGRFYIWRKDNLRIIQVMDYAKKTAREWWAQRNSGEAPGSDVHDVLGLGMFIEVYREPRDKVWQEAWRVTEADLLMMRDEVAQNHAQFYVVVLSSDIQVNPNVSDRQKLTSYPRVEDIFYQDHRVEKFCRSHNIPVLLLGPPFQEYATQHHVYFHGFRSLFQNTLGTGHWNRDGHRLAGETIAQWLCPQLN